jgi:rod shape-determining protein MreD
MPRTATTIAVSLLIVLLQSTLVPFLAIGTIVPDLVLLWVVYLAVSRGQIAATTAGFFLGLVMDMMSGNEGMLGLFALAKTASGFLAGYAYSENRIQQTLAGGTFLLLSTAVALVHYLLYFLIFLQGSALSWDEGLVQYGLPSTAYTVAVGILPMLVFRRKYRL